MTDVARPPAPRAAPGLAAYKAILLDRDGTLNVERADYVRTVHQLVLLPRTVDALEALGVFSIPVAVVTNQSCIGRGVIDEAMLDAIHARLTTLCAAAGVAIAGYFVCPHTPDAGCDCRKPQPGLLLAAAAALDVPIQECIMIGDSISDHQAARAAGCAMILVRSGRQGAILDDWVHDHARDDGSLRIVDDLLAAVQLLARDGLRPEDAAAGAGSASEAPDDTYTGSVTGSATGSARERTILLQATGLM